MKDPLEHEHMRFKTMTQTQLLTRLGKITKPEKLVSFIIIAKEYHYDILVKMAEKILQGGITPKAKIIIPKPIKPKQPEKMKTQNPSKRALIF